MTSRGNQRREKQPEEVKGVKTIKGKSREGRRETKQNTPEK